MKMRIAISTMKIAIVASLLVSLATTVAGLQHTSPLQEFHRQRHHRKLGKSDSSKSAKSSSSSKSIKTSSPTRAPTTTSPTLSESPTASTAIPTEAPTSSPVDAPRPRRSSSKSAKSGKSSKADSRPVPNPVPNPVPIAPNTIPNPPSSSKSAKSAKSTKKSTSKSTKKSSSTPPPPFTTVVSADGEALTSCQNTAIPSNAISVTFQQLDWSFGFCSSQGDVSDSILMRVEQDIIDEYLSCDYFNGDAWHVASVWFDRNAGATCTPDGNGCWDCTHSFRLEVVEMPTTRALAQQASIRDDNQEDRQRHLALVATVSEDSTTFTRITNSLTTIVNGLLNELGISSISFQGLSNSFDPDAPSTTTTEMVTTTTSTTTSTTALPNDIQVVEEVLTTETTTTTSTTTEATVVSLVANNGEEEEDDSTPDNTIDALQGPETDTVTERSDDKNVHVAAVLTAAFGAFFVVAIAAVVGSRRLRRMKGSEADRQAHILMEDDNGEGLEVSLEKNNVVLDGAGREGRALNSAATFDTVSDIADSDIADSDTPEESSIDGPIILAVTSGEGNFEDATLERLPMPSYDSDDDEVPTERNVEFIKCSSDPDQLRSVMRDLERPEATSYTNEDESLRVYDHHDTVVL